MEADTDQSKHITYQPAPRIVDLAGAAGVADRVRLRLRRSVIGREEVIDLLIAALLADGHVLLEDYPGSGKTTLAKALGDCIIDDLPDDKIVAIRRIQFTPDLLPSDITGSMIFDPNTNQFYYRPGPIFAHVVLADEINRTSPKVQASLLEAMAEKQVTVDNRTRALDAFFFVIATQNPLDLAGTFPLPRAQLDRFLFKIRMTHVSKEAELEILRSIRQRRQEVGDELRRVTRTEILDARRVVEEKIYVAPAIQEALVNIARATRNDKRVLQGASTRALVLASAALQARALLCGRDYVNADDVQYLAPYVFAHRIELAPGAGEPEEVIAACCREPIETVARQSLRR